MSLSSRIKEQREKLGLSRKELAELLGVTASAIANYENGISLPKVELIYPLMKSLKCDANYLYQDEMDAAGGVSVKLMYSEIEHIKKYRTLDEYGKELIDVNLNLEVNRVQQQSQTVSFELAARDGHGAVIETTKEQIEKGESLAARLIAQGKDESDL